MKKIAVWIAKIVKNFATTELPQSKEERIEVIKKFNEGLETNQIISEILPRTLST